MRSHRKCKSYIHSRRIALNGRVEKTLNFGERHDLVELLPNLALRHPEDGTIKEDVFATCQLGMKSRPDFEQACDASSNQNAPISRLGDAAEDFEERALAGSVATNDANDFARFDLEAYVFEGPELLDLIALNDLSAAEHVDCFSHKISGLTADDLA